jgi:hypothetical protein
MKKAIAALAGILTISAARAGMLDFYAGATAATGYGAVYLPGSLPNADKNLFGDAQAYGVAVGLDIPVFRIEGEYDYLASKHVGLHALLANIYWKLLPTPIVKPYLGLGLGMVAGGTVKLPSGSMGAQSSPALQGMLGLQVAIPLSSLFADIELRLLYADDIYTYSGTDWSVGYLQSDVRAKLRYAF